MSNFYKQISVLYIEDDPIDQMVFKRSVKAQNLPYDLTLTDSVEQTKVLFSCGAEFDIIISDYQLKDGDFFDIIEIIKDIPIIFVTGAGNQEVAVKAMKVGVYDYIIKDMEREYLELLPLQIEETLSKHNAQRKIKLLETAVINANDAIAIFNIQKDILDSTIDFSNPIFKNLFRIEDHTKLTLGSLIHQQNNKSQTTRILELILQKNTSSAEICLFQTNDQTDGVWIEINFASIPSEKEDFSDKLVAFARDISVRKKNEKLLRQAKIDAEEAKKAEQQFLAVMSHEIRTPITSITGLTKLLSDTTLADSQLQYVTAIKNSTEQLLALVNDILDLSKIEKKALELSNRLTNLKELLATCTLPLQHMANSKNIKFIIDFDEEIREKVLVDSVKLNQIIVNLVSNAIKFTKQGEVTLKAKALENQAGQYKIQFSIKDSGIGISPEELPFIFDKYKQLEASKTHKQKGTGLGLYIVKNLVELFDSHLIVESEMNVGTTFTFTLDLEKSQKSTLYTENTQFVSLSDLNILIVEDNELNKEILSKLLENLGANPIGAANGLEAIEHIISDQKIDLILMDMNMPLMGGAEAIDIIRTNLLLDWPIIVLSANDPGHRSNVVVEGKVEAIMSKPFQFDTFGTKVTEILSKHPNNKARYHIANKKMFDLEPLKAISSDPNFIGQLIQLIHNKSIESIVGIKKAIANKDYETLSFIAHKMKSSALQINNEALAYLCTSTQEAGEKEHTERLITLSKALAINCQLLIDAFVEEFPYLIQDNIKNSA